MFMPLNEEMYKNEMHKYSRGSKKNLQKEWRVARLKPDTVCVSSGCLSE